MFTRFVIVALCGALFSAAFPPFGLWWLLFAMVPLFLYVAESRKLRSSFWLGFFFGVPFFSFHLFWLPSSFASPELFGPVAWIIFPPIVLLVSTFWGLVTLMSRFLGRRGAGTLWLLPAVWLLMEWARTQGTFAFPWGSLAYIWLGTPLAQTADIAGSYGLSFFTLVIVALMSVPFLKPLRPNLTRNTWLSVSLSLLLASSALWYSNNRLLQVVPAPDRQALLVQGNTDPLGRAQGLEDDLSVYTRLTANALSDPNIHPELVIWPEAAVLTGYIEGFRGEATRERIQASAGDASVVTGAGIFDDGKSYNSIYGLENAQVTDRYDKVYLVPFGESLPFLNALQPLYTTVYGWFGLGAYGRTAGDSFHPLNVDGLVTAAYICYESVFPQVARSMVRQGGQVLINISNDAWFGRGSGAEQHYLMGSMRAIETRRYILRAGNDGVTAVIDPLGRTLQRFERGREGVLLANFALNDTKTPYVLYGDWLIVLLLIYTIILGASYRLLRPAPETNPPASNPAIT